MLRILCLTSIQIQCAGVLVTDYCSWTFKGLLRFFEVSFLVRPIIPFLMALWFVDLWLNWRSLSLDYAPPFLAVKTMVISLVFLLAFCKKYVCLPRLGCWRVVMYLFSLLKILKDKVLNLSSVWAVFSTIAPTLVEFHFLL